MPKKVLKKLLYQWYREKFQAETGEIPPIPEPVPKPSAGEHTLSLSLDENLAYVKKTLGNGGDLIVRDFCYAEGTHRAALIYLDGMVNSDLITQSILQPILCTHADVEAAALKNLVLCGGDVTESLDMATLLDKCLYGDTVLLADGYTKGIIVSTKGWDKRAVSEPQTESVVRGPREGFTENFRTNTALLRRRIKNTALRMDQIQIGRKTNTNVCICYIENVVRPEVVEMVKTRLSAIKTDAVLDSGYLEEFIEDAPFSIFPTLGYTEKPDVAAAKVLEGRVCIIVDGSPFVLTAPMLFIESFQTSEDYAVRSFYASFNRFLRFFAYFITVFGPAIYVAITTYHQELIPSTLLFTIAQAREGTPFPAFIEALIMVFSFEILREAGVRLPRPVGQAISIVGALIMGDAAVSAGLVGAPMVITIAITAVSGFAVPEHTDSIIILRLLAMICAAVLGGFGLAVAVLAILIHLGSLKSFGVAYFDGFTASRNQQDTIVRMPLWFMKKRPKGIVYHDVVRTQPFIPPAEKNSENGGG